MIGILIILFLSENLKPEIIPIANITKDYLDKEVNIIGEVTNIRETPGLYIITLQDKTDSIPVVIFKEENLNLTRYQYLDISGKVVEYKNQLEVQAEVIKVL